MSLKHLLVHVDSSARAQVRIDLALVLARRFGASLTGLFSESPLLGPAIVGRRTPADVSRTIAAARAGFEARAQAAGVPHQWWQIESVEYGEVVGWTVVSCRYADLCVFGQHDESLNLLPDDLLEQVLLESGRPMLVVPAVGSYPDAGRRVVVSWTGSRDSARALNDALPLIQGAEQVTVLAFQHPSADTEGPGAQLDIMGHLRAHGVTARFERTIMDDFGMVDHILNRASDWSADLTVVGGYGAMRAFPYLPRSKTTRDLLRTMTTPLLLSH